MIKLGKTDQYPQGKLNKYDEGELQLAVAADPEKKLLVLDFGTPVKWIGLPKETAISFANLILKRAQELK